LETTETTFFETEQGSLLYLNRKLPTEDVPGDMMNYMLSSDNINAVIRLRDDLTLCGNDGSNYRIEKTMGPEKVKFTRHIIEGKIPCARVFDSWKEARTVLIYKKGDRDDPKNRRPITITQCVYQIYTCLMAKAFQEINSRVDNLFRWAERFYQEDEWMQRIWHHSEQILLRCEGEEEGLDNHAN
jgi:hypothetical protein